MVFSTAQQNVSWCGLCEYNVSVAEDDEVGRQTNVNLTRFLQTRKQVRVVYTILNKARNIRSYPDIKERAKQRQEFSMLGVIPFDLDVFDEFGSDAFWTTVLRTLYFRAVLDAWNELARTKHVRELAESKYAFPPRIFMQASQGRFTLWERVMRAYSILFILAGTFLWFYRQYRYREIDTFQLYAVLSMLLGVVTLLISTSGFQAFIKGQARRQKD